MDIAEGPAVLGGIVIWAALGAWALGRWQGGLVAPADLPASTPSQQPSGEAGPAPDYAAKPSARAPHRTPCQDAARDERRIALAAAPSLGEVHDEITAYRRTEHILAQFAEEMPQIHQRHGAGMGGCRFVGLTGEPTCGVPGAARMACMGGVPCANASPRAGQGQVLAAQPSWAVPGATRV